MTASSKSGLVSCLNSTVTASSSLLATSRVLWHRLILWRWSVVIAEFPVPIGRMFSTMFRISSSVMSAMFV